MTASDTSEIGPWTVVNDYSKTVVSVAAAFLAFTGTFATGERFANAAPWLLFVCWSFLTASIAAALFSVGRLTSILRGKSSRANGCILAANISYFGLFAATVAFLAFATQAMRGSRSGVQAHPKPLLGVVNFTTPPFRSASSSEPAKDVLQAVCEMRRQLRAAEATVVMVVGQHDRRELLSMARGRFGSNSGLAQQRADHVRDLLLSNAHCNRDQAAVGAAISVVNGPTKTSIRAVGTALEEALADDRRVKIVGFRVVSQPAVAVSPIGKDSQQP